MALNTYKSSGPGSTGTGAGASIANLESAEQVALEFVVEAIGATPTVTFKLQGSNNNTDWVDIKTVDAGGTSAVGATVTVTGTSWLFAWSTNNAPEGFFKYYRSNVTANTNITFRANILTIDD